MKTEKNVSKKINDTCGDGSRLHCPERAGTSGTKICLPIIKTIVKKKK
jgi:hypothetical protein